MPPPPAPPGSNNNNSLPRPSRAAIHAQLSSLEARISRIQARIWRRASLPYPLRALLSPHTSLLSRKLHRLSMKHDSLRYGSFAWFPWREALGDDNETPLAETMVGWSDAMVDAARAWAGRNYFVARRWVDGRGCRRVGWERHPLDLDIDADEEEEEQQQQQTRRRRRVTLAGGDPDGDGVVATETQLRAEADVLRALRDVVLHERQVRRGVFENETSTDMVATRVRRVLSLDERERRRLEDEVGWLEAWREGLGGLERLLDVEIAAMGEAVGDVERMLGDIYCINRTVDGEGV